MSAGRVIFLVALGLFLGRIGEEASTVLVASEASPLAVALLWADLHLVGALVVLETRS